jgi:hypothetical protein
MGSYASIGDSGARLTGVSFGATALTNPIGCRFSVEIEDDPRRPDGGLFPTQRPVMSVDARAVVRFLDGSAVQSYSASAANIVASFAEADGGSGSYTMGKFVPRSYDREAEPVPGGFPTQQEFRLMDSSLTDTVSY